MPASEADAAARPPGAGAPTVTSSNSRTLQLQVIGVAWETADTASFLMTPLGDAMVDYRPGQFLTLRIPHAPDRSVARSYSLSSSPAPGEPLRVTVKRVPGGLGSNWLCDTVQPGQRLEAIAPSGLFVPSDLDRDLLLIAGGSGVTPMFSILQAALSRGRGRVTLIDVNRDAGSIIFAGALEELALAHPSRLRVIHWLTSERGRPTVEDLETLVAPLTNCDAFLCGPEALMAASAEALRAAGAPPDRITKEAFLSLSGDPFAPVEAPSSPRDSDTCLELDLYGEAHHLAWPQDMVLLDLLLSQGLDPAYSCREGSCGMCVCKLAGGRVRLRQNHVLGAKDLADGYILACQALPEDAACKVVF